MARSEVAQAAQQLREALRAEGFEIVSCVSKRFSMGSSIDVTVRDTTPEQTEKASAIANEFQYGDFNGMDDSYTYRKDRPEGRCFAKYVFCRVEYSEEKIAECTSWILEQHRKQEPGIHGQEVFKRFKVWNDRFGLDTFEGLSRAVLAGRVEPFDFWNKTINGREAI